MILGTLIMMGSKAKKRVVLPTRPDPPSVEQILDDVSRASPNDPLFSVLHINHQAAGMSCRSADSEAENCYQQSKRFLELNERLLGALGSLTLKREELRAVGEQLERSVADVKGTTL